MRLRASAAVAIHSSKKPRSPLRSARSTSPSSSRCASSASAMRSPFSTKMSAHIAGFAPATRVISRRDAPAKPAMWADIFVENGDLIADALEAHRDELGDVERALRNGDRGFFEEWIATAAEARSRMLGYAYQTDARALNRIRIRVPDKPGVLARITQTLGAAGINIEDFELRHVSPDYGGVLVLSLIHISEPTRRTPIS